MIDQQPPVHPVGPATAGKFFMFAKNENVPEFWYNDIDVPGPAVVAQGQ